MISISIKGIDKTINELRKKVSSETTLKANRVINETVLALKKATPVDTGNARDHWHREDNTIVNDVPYIQKLNEGSSTQAPAHFVEQTVLNNPDVKPRGFIIREY